MVAARPKHGPEDADERRWATRAADSADWLTLQQAACELNVSVSTVRRRIRQGELRNRLLPRPGGCSYLVHLPESRHGRGLACDDHDHASTNGHAPAAAPVTHDAEIRRLEDQVVRLSEALSRALRTKQRALPEGIGRPGVSPDEPYARYRWLVRKRRWWPF